MTENITSCITGMHNFTSDVSSQRNRGFSIFWVVDRQPTSVDWVGKIKSLFVSFYEIEPLVQVKMWGR